MVDTKHYQQQLTNLNCLLCEKRPEYQIRQHKVIFLRDSDPSHTANWFAAHWKHSARKLYLMWLNHQTSDLHLFALIGQKLADQHFSSFEGIKKWLAECFMAKG